MSCFERTRGREPVLDPDEAHEFLSELNDRVCNGCLVKHLCPMHDPEDPEKESCKALMILERLFLNGKISFKQATVPADLPPQDKKIVYDLEGF